LLTQGEATVKRLTRMLLLSGVVALTIALGRITGPSSLLPAAEARPAPTREAVTANTDFALDLYGRLAGAETDRNLFFSPYSISTALAMVVEGARGETAEEMGRVLRFPQATRRQGDEAQLTPWNTALIHAGQAALNERFNAGSRSAPAELRQRVARLRKDLDAANQEAARQRRAGDIEASNIEARKSQQIAAELNRLLVRIDPYELRVANAMWAEKTYPFRKAYLDTINKYYQTGGVFPVDFRTDFEGARTEINNWVEKQTHERIKDLVPPGALNKDARLVLTNAIYFRGEWVKVFDAAHTKPQPFTLAGGTRVEVPMMSHDEMGGAHYAAFKAGGTFFPTPTEVSSDGADSAEGYPDKQGFQMLELPYKGDDLSMVVVAPRSADGLPAVEKLLTARNLTAWLGKLQSRKVNVALPKFRLETNYDLGDDLEALGMKRAFRDPRKPNGAQFDGMSESANPAEKLCISKVLHKAFVEVNEKGTEAAAGTVVILIEKSAERQLRPFTPTFRADRPFLFLIRDRQTGSILFLGRMSNPKAA
jgi:serpin B